MVQSGRESPAKEVNDMNLPSSPRWVFRPPNTRRKMKRSATPHPGKTGDNTKLDALVPLTETGRARKKIVFEFVELAAGINGGSNTLAGGDNVSSPTGDKKGGRWTRKARPGPFEASNDASDVVLGVLPLLAEDLRFSMGKTDGLDGNQREVVAGKGQTGVAGFRLEDDRPEETVAVAQSELRSTSVGVDACAAAMDEDSILDGNGANLRYPLLLHYFWKSLAMY